MNNLNQNIYNALQFLDPNCDQETWIKIGTALKSEGDEYLADWDRWSSGGSSYKVGECDRRWKHLQANKVGIGTLFHLAKQNGFELDREDNSENFTQLLQQRKASAITRKKAQAEEEAKRLNSLPSIEERDRKIKRYPKNLKPHNRANVAHRGLTQDEIGFAVSNHWLFDCEGGYGIAAIDPVTGLLCGAQKARDDRDPKYDWSIFAGKNHLKETDENPLFVRVSPDFDNSTPCEIHYCEKALGSLIYAFMQWRTNPQIIVIGAAGGQFGKQSLIRVLGALPQTDKHILFPDAGSVINNGVCGNYKKLEQHLEALGINLQVADWGQFAVKKSDGGKDCDELGANFDYKLIQSSEYFAQSPNLIKQSVQWLIGNIKQAKKKIAKGFTNKLPEPESTNYDQGDRVDTWLETFRKKSKNILDASFTGGGKSHTVGKLRPEMFKEFGITRIIYVHNDPRNVSTSTLKDWTLVPARHNGIIDEQGQSRRAKPNTNKDELITSANCSRVEAINALRSKGITNDKTVCATCPVLNQCRNASGDGYGFKHERMIALQADRLICHPSALPHPDEFDYSNTLLVFEEPSESFNLQREVKVMVKDIDKIIIKLADAGIVNEFMPLFKVLRELLGDRTLRYGFDYHDIKCILPNNLPSKEILGDALIPDLSSFLTPPDSIDDSEFDKVKGKDKKLLAKVNKFLRRETTMYSHEVEELIQGNVLTQWLPEFLDIATGITSGDLNIQYGALTITIADYHLRAIANKAAKNLFLDATLHPIDLEMKLGAPVTVVKQSGTMPMPKIIQVPDLGRMGQQRGNEQIRRKEAIVSHIKTNSTNKITKVIDFKGNESDGIWWLDSRGSNRFADAHKLITVGTPCRNIAALKAEYSVLTGLHPDKDDQDFAKYIDRKILADIQQGFGRKAGNRFRDGDEIYFISDFDLGDIPHTKVKAGEITPDAMSETEKTEKWLCDRLTELFKAGHNLLELSDRALTELIGVTRGQFRWFQNSVKSWVVALYSSLNSSTTQDLNEIESMSQIPDPPPIDEPIIDNPIPIALPRISILDIGKQVIDIRTHCQAVLEAFTLNEAKKTVARFGDQIVDPQYLRLVA